MALFDKFADEVASGAQGLAKATLKGFINEAKSDALDFIKQAADDLKNWTGMLAKGELSKVEFGSLGEGQKDLAHLGALTQAGIALARLDRFRDALVNLVDTAAFKTFLS